MTERTPQLRRRTRSFDRLYLAKTRTENVMIIRCLPRLPRIVRRTQHRQRYWLRRRCEFASLRYTPGLQFHAKGSCTTGRRLTAAMRIDAAIVDAWKTGLSVHGFEYFPPATTAGVEKLYVVLRVIS